MLPNGSRGSGVLSKKKFKVRAIWTQTASHSMPGKELAIGLLHRL